RLVFAGAIAFGAAACGPASDLPPVANPECQGVDEAGNVTLCTPKADEGFQLATPTFDVPPGHEGQDCHFFRVPSPDDVFLRRIEVAQNAGSHHMNIFRVESENDLSRGADDGTVVTGRDGEGPCFDSANWSDWSLVVNSQQSSNDGDTGY